MAWNTRVIDRLRLLKVRLCNRGTVGRALVPCLEAAGHEGEPAFVVEPKIDGSAISLVYEGGAFFRGATRGDGLRGSTHLPNAGQLAPLTFDSSLSGSGIVAASITPRIANTATTSITPSAIESDVSADASPRC